MRFGMLFVLMVLVVAVFVIPVALSCGCREAAGNEVTGRASVSFMQGSPMYAKMAVNLSQKGFATLAYAGNEMQPSYVTKALGKGSVVPTRRVSAEGTLLYFKDIAVGRERECIRGTAWCEGNVFVRCVGGSWESTEQCKESEVCTPKGCRMIRWSRYPLVTITQRVMPETSVNATSRRMPVRISI